MTASQFLQSAGSLLRRFVFISLAIGLGSTVLTGCGQEPVVVPSRTLDRPTDLAFLCLRSNPTGLGGRNVVSATPMSECTATPLKPGDSRDALSPSRTLGLMGLVTNSARGELGAVDFDRNRMVDLDPAIPGFNMLPVGQLPESVAVSSDGCKAVSANRGSCDLSLVDTSRLLAGAFPTADAVTGAGAVATRFKILTDTGPLQSRPAEVLFVPESTESASQCSVDGLSNAGLRKPWRAIVSFPSCGLVALVELPSGRLLNSVYVRASGVEPAGTNPQCPTDCGNVDVGSTGGLPPGRIAVESMTFLPFSRNESSPGQELYVAARDSDVLVPLKVTDLGALVEERPPLKLAEGANGVFRLRPSVEPFAPTATAFISEGNVGRYIYVVAGDSSVRVVDISNTAIGVGEVECDVNIDSKVLATAPDLNTACVPVSSGLPRRLRAKGPGIQIPPLAAGPDLSSPHPVDVSFFRARAWSDVAETVGRAYDGVFAYVLLSNSDILVVNLDTKQTVSLLGDTAPRRPFPHTLRNALNFLELEKGGKRPRVFSVPTSSLGTNDLPFGVRAELTRETAPRIEGFPNTTSAFCSPEASITTPVTIYACFDRPEETIAQSWAVIWEGNLNGTDRSTGRLAKSPAAPLSPNTLGVWEDVGANYCASGVQDGDIVRLVGCNVDTDCGPADDFTCVPSVAGTQGLCARKAKAAAFLATCGRFLRSRRRYEVTFSGAKQLGLGLKLQEIPKPSISTCTVDADCKITGIAGFACAEPNAGKGKRCVVPCATDAGCASGFVCEVTGIPAAGFCVEAPVPNPDCLAETSIYRVQAGKSFLVQGSFAPSFASTVNSDGRCEPLSSRNPRFANRIPLSAPHCANTGASILDEDSVNGVPASALVLQQSPMTASGFSNPCLFQAVNGDDEPGTDPAFKASAHVKALFEGPDTRFVITNLEQPFGDGATLQFQVKGGFQPDQVVTRTQPQIAIPTMMITGPTIVPAAKDDNPLNPARYPYVYIVDSGRLGSEQHGQILRLDTRRAGYDVSVSTHPFQIR